VTIAPGASAESKSSGDAVRARPADKQRRLVICTAMTVMPGRRDGSFILTRKFLDGVLEYVKHWPGSVAVWVARATRPDTNLDHVEVHPSELPFNLRWIDGAEEDEQRFLPAIQSADLVLAALVDRHVCLSKLCHLHGVPLVYVTEYSVKTRRQIIRAETRNPLLRWRRERFNVKLERQYESAVSLASGVQCNGWPTYHAYRGLNDRALLYFDTRVRQSQLISPTALELRLSEMRSKPLRLAFSGRLIAMKGADHLALVAQELKRLNVPFSLDICGGGTLEAKVRRDIARFGLRDEVRLRGVLDFESELLPFIARNIDLFVCCHRQGDPSCTYLETYSCGVPIVGYGNEAFAGLAETSRAGGPEWVTPLDDPITLARKIADLHGRRDEVVAASYNALAFASQHTFEHTMRTRVQHMLDCLSAHDQMRANQRQHSQPAPA
jgi:colanic acid/amylovoran biosynthesis glycosyltransferase